MSTILFTLFTTNYHLVIGYVEVDLPHGLVTPTPAKRPKAYITRLEAVQPNETWQGDFTHWRLADGSDVEIINWLDDHSRFLLHCSVYKAITGEIVINTFNECRNKYGKPFSTLTHNSGALPSSP